jgi:hypothetical protein
MPAALPCSLTQTADGRDLYIYDNQGAPAGSVVYFNSLPGTGGVIGGNVPFNIVYPVYNPAVPSVIGVGLGVPIPPGVYLFRLSVPSEGAAPNGLTKACFVGTWDGTNLTAGGASSPDNFNTSSAFIGTSTNGTTGVPNILTWGFTGLVGSVNVATLEVVLLQQLPYILPLV